MMRVLRLWMPGLASAVVGLLLGTFFYGQSLGGLVALGGFAAVLTAAVATAGMVSIDDTIRPYFTNSPRTGDIAAIAQSPDRLGRALVRMYTRPFFPVAALTFGTAIIQMVVSTGLLSSVSWPLPNESQLGAAFVVAMVVMLAVTTGLVVVGTVRASLGGLTGFALGTAYAGLYLSIGGEDEELGPLIISALAGLVAVSIGVVALVRALVRRRRAGLSERSGSIEVRPGR